ncbi:MAG: hypothetical protein IPI04_06280 [Ignavibacteria bacterium]|nr:hypothetical protein [Ignavibacteria bacterium]
MKNPSNTLLFPSWNYKKDIELTGENENPVSYKLIASNFIKTGNTTKFDISIQNIGSEQIWLRSIQCVFRFPRNNVSNLIVASNYIISGRCQH